MVTVLMPTINACASCAGSLEFKSQAGLSCKRFATASTSIQVAVLPWRYDAEMGTANLLHASDYTASIMKGLVYG